MGKMSLTDLNKEIREAHNNFLEKREALQWAYKELLNDSKAKFKILEPEISMAVHQFTISEEISSCFVIKLSLVSDLPIDGKDVINKPCLLTIKGPLGKRHFQAFTSQFVSTGKTGEYYLYQAIASPLMSFLVLNRDCRIRQNMTTIAIVRDILNKNNLVERVDFEFRGIKEDDYEVRRTCVQIHENDLNHVCRLLEEDGIYFFFEHSEDRHKIVFADKNNMFNFISGTPQLPLNPGSGMEAREESVSSFTMEHNVFTDKITQKSYNFKKAATNLEMKDGGENSEYENYDYTCNYGDSKIGKRLTRVRREQSEIHANIADGRSNCTRLMSGFTFNLTGHSISTLNKSYIITGVEHRGGQKHALGEQSGIGGDFHYSNTFTVIPEKVTYRPPRRAKKPRIIGFQSATVVGPEKGAAYRDKYGRVKIQFHWDREGKNDENSSGWVQIIQTWAGLNRGAIFTPRVGDEVMVAFKGGDPDWPIIAGCVHNSENPPFFDTEGKSTISSIKTRSMGGKGFNELRFDDKAGGEEIFIHGQKDCNITVKSRMGQTIGGDSGTVIGGKCMQKITGDNYCEVGGKSTEIANEIVLSAASKITLVIGATSIEMSPAGFMINSPRVDLNNGGGATAPVTEPVSGSLGHTGPGSPPPADAGKSSSVLSSETGNSKKPALQSEKSSSPEHGKLTHESEEIPEDAKEDWVLEAK